MSTSQNDIRKNNIGDKKAIKQELEDSFNNDTPKKEGPVSVMRILARTDTGNIDLKRNSRLYMPHSDTGTYITMANQLGLGESKYDERLGGINIYDITPEDVQNNRAYSQSNWAKIGAGLGKATVLAGTTFADTFIGTVVGLGNMVVQGVQGENMLNAFINNPVSKYLNEVNNMSEEWMPNYYSTDEDSRMWYQNFFSANFIGDHILKNLGFLVGALLAWGCVFWADLQAQILRLKAGER